MFLCVLLFFLKNNVFYLIFYISNVLMLKKLNLHAHKKIIKLNCFYVNVKSSDTIFSSLLFNLIQRHFIDHFLKNLPLSPMYFYLLSIYYLIWMFIYKISYHIIFRMLILYEKTRKNNFEEYCVYNFLYYSFCLILKLKSHGVLVT